MLFFILSPSIELKEEELSFYREAGIRNFIFFKRHFEEGDFSEYITRLKQSLKGLILLCVDQEGGKVARIPGDYPSPLSMARLRKEKGDKVFFEWASSLAKAVKSQGLNVNLAPCVDLADEKAPDFLKERTFGLNPEEVIECAKVFYYAHKEQGIVTCLKHFPGLGGVEVDPHEDLPRKRYISEKDLMPFKSLSSLYPMVMTTHLSFDIQNSLFDSTTSLSVIPNSSSVIPSTERVPSSQTLPSTFSEKIVRLLRDVCNFKGLILTDDLNMKALKHYELAERFILSLACGHNCLLYCGPYRDVVEIWDDLRKEIEKSAVLQEKAKESLFLLEKLKRSLKVPE